MNRYEIGFNRLSCDWEIIYFSSAPAKNLESHILAYIDNYSQQFSRFESSSLLSQLNQKRALFVNETFLSLLEWSLYFHQQTEGLFNPLASPYHIGYQRSFGTDTWKKAENVANMDLSELEVEDRMIRLAPGQQLDFGGLGKGYLVDQLAPFLHALSDHFLINAGGDIYAFGGKPSGENWQVAMETPDQTLAANVLSLHTACAATSGIYKRKSGDKHHILDPRTQTSAQTQLQGVTVVVGDRCTITDAIATTLIIQNDMENLAWATAMGVEISAFTEEGLKQTSNFSQFLSFS